MNDFLDNIQGLTASEHDDLFRATVQLIAARVENGSIELSNGVDHNRRNWMRDCVETAIKAWIFTHPGRLNG